MKLIQRLTLLSSLALLATACDLQQTFDERIDDKQLLVLTPDFADTSVQLVFRDPETLAVLDEDFEVTVYSNKRLVDLNGNYKNQFIARGGVMEFSVSPEETVTESDPLEISISALSADGTKIVSYQDASLKRSGFISLPITPEMVPDESEFDFTQNTLAIGPKSENILSKEAEEPRLRLLYNGQPLVIDLDDPGFKNILLLTGIKAYSLWLSGGIDAGVERGFTTGGYKFLNEGASSASFENYLNPYKTSEPLRIKVDGPVSLIDYSLIITYWGLNKRTEKIKINQDGFIQKISIGSTFSFGPNLVVSEEKLNSYFHLTILPRDIYIGIFELTSFNREKYASCPSGFNLKIEGLESGTGTNLLYRATRENDNKIFAIASFTADSPSFTYNSLQWGSQDTQYIYKGGNRLEFMENSQYIIEPQVIDLGGEELCGNTYTVRLKRRDTHKKHQLNLSMRNENQNVGLALTFSALLRKQGQDNASWETVNFKQGSTSLFLEEGSTYEVKLTLADEPFEFTFTNDLSLVEAAVQATLRNVTRIKDIKYSISESAEANTIDAEIVFYQGQSLID